ncbi:tRNA (adenosine(37)-N6)-threonylcarbamoyltransferase complex dimerization subunit type 1 TsaB [Propylenella binzhouense]|uniref:N(6)-L-threonylcarbamoyladenine synthase n=1 Tax=Propylenella binzhouense TaxID=2555902 RepID=A0A964T2T1_9HYPH|nr:tRNA (adenosine(37)-N6)-threonylcarbamoyltransferase complex dimerization subunit type 1 TsaB [Propylenella binzhouense]MYZ47423.1 tRNA (adenosine(37)-N6)-threonylcarbamoyltransferase complex dimerization subunit type 1 TsaB [Propylenella binzhouense]
MLLAIDTAGPNCAAALARAGEDGSAEILARREIRVERGHAEHLFPLVEAVLADAAIGYPDLDRIAVTVGPGSFTGVRVGVAAARGLALALGRPACGIGVLEALLFPLRSAGGTAVAALDAKREEVYAAIATQDGLNLPPCLLDYDGLTKRIEEFGAPLILTGSAAPALKTRLAAIGLAAETATAADHADIAAVAGLALAGAGISPPRPLYLRPPDAKPQAGKAIARA